MADSPTISTQFRQLVDDWREMYVIATKIVTLDEYTNVTIEDGTTRPTFYKRCVDRFNELIEKTGYDFVGDYEAGINITDYFQIVRDTNGEFWRISNEADLPYTTTGAGLEAESFIPVGDGYLRTEFEDFVSAMSSPQGAEQVGYSDPFGASTVAEALDSRSPILSSYSDLSLISTGALNPGQAVSVMGSLFRWSGSSWEPAGTIDGSAFGIQPGQDVTDGLKDLCQIGGSVQVTQPGVYTISDTIVLADQTDLYLAEGVIIQQANGTNKTMFVNQAYSDGTRTKNKFIRIHGPGTIDYNQANQAAAGGLSTMAVIIKSVEHVIVDGIQGLNAKKYVWLIADYDRLDAMNLYFNTHSDGLHVQPPGKHTNIKNLKGTTGDDLVSLTIGDYANYNISETGDFTNVDIDGLFADDALTAVKVTGDGNGVFQRIVARNIYGSFTNAGIRVWGDTNLENTIIKYMKVENFCATVADGYPTIEVNDRGFGTLDMDRLDVAGVHSNRVATDSCVRVSGTSNCKIRHLDISGVGRDQYTVCEVTNDPSTVSIDYLNIHDSKVQLRNDVNSSVVLNRAEIAQLNIANCSFGCYNQTTGQVVRAINGSYIGTFNFSSSDVNGGVIWNQTSGTLAASPTVNMSSIVHVDPDRVVAHRTGEMRLNMSACQARGTQGSPLFYSYGSGTVIIFSGEFDTNFTTLQSSSGGTFLMNGIVMMPANIALVSHQVASGCINTNAEAGGVGLGIALSNGITWKNLY